MRGRRRPGWPRCARRLADTWREPGTRIGLYTHLVTQFSGTVFALLWGYPFLVVGEGRSPATAAGLLTLLVRRRHGRRAAARPALRALAAAPLGPGLRASSRATAASGPSSCCGPGRAPLWLLVVLVVVLGTNGPGSMIGFDYARTENPVERQGSASGVVNVGGFVASLLTILAIGAVLDLLTPGALDRLQPRRLPRRVLRAVRVLGDRAGRGGAAPAAAARPAGPRRRRPGAAVRGGRGPAARRLGLPLTAPAVRSS